MRPKAAGQESVEKAESIEQIQTGRLSPCRYFFNRLTGGSFPTWLPARQSSLSRQCLFLPALQLPRQASLQSLAF